MRKMGIAVAVMALSLAASAKDTMQGTIVSENSMACGSETKGKKQSELMCQEYAIRSGETTYHVRQEKSAHKDILPMNAPVEFSLNKDRMKFKVNGKSYEMLVVSVSAVQ